MESAKIRSQVSECRDYMPDFSPLVKGVGCGERGAVEPEQA